MFNAETGAKDLTEKGGLLAGWGAARDLPAHLPGLWLKHETSSLPPAFQRFSAPDAKPVRMDGRVVGIAWEDDDAHWALLAGVLPRDLAAQRSDQATSVFEGIDRALAIAGMGFCDVVRTWLYLDELLEWYDDFNKSRDAFFRKMRVHDGLVPASTGIGCANPFGAAITAGALAIRPKASSSIKIRAVESPLQRSALEYGSTFSRAVEIETPRRRDLLISGTASISADGATIHPTDASAQLETTLQVVEAILHSRKMDWSDSRRGLLYLKHDTLVPLWKDWTLRRGLQNLPVSVVQADVCRDNLLVELELDAAK